MCPVLLSVVLIVVDGDHVSQTEHQLGIGPTILLAAS